MMDGVASGKKLKKISCANFVILQRFGVDYYLAKDTVLQALVFVLAVALQIG